MCNFTNTSAFVSNWLIPLLDLFLVLHCIVNSMYKTFLRKWKLDLCFMLGLVMSCQPLVTKFKVYRFEFGLPRITFY
jgi:hypothetical protein